MATNAEILNLTCQAIVRTEYQTNACFFQVNDLYEAKNLYLVINNLHLLGGLAQKLGFRGPAIGARQPVGDTRRFDEKTLKEGQSVISLQYGSNKGASQAGMTAWNQSGHQDGRC